MDVSILHKDCGVIKTYKKFDVHHVTVILSNGMEFILKERVDNPGMLDISSETTIQIVPRSTNVIRLRLE